MDITNRITFPAQSSAKSRAAEVEGGQFEPLIDFAANLAHGAGRRLADTGRWLESHAMGNHTFTTLGVAFGLGVLTGWLIKRR